MNLVLKIIQQSQDFTIDRPFFYNIKLIGSEEAPSLLTLFNGYVVNPQ